MQVEQLDTKSRLRAFLETSMVRNTILGIIIFNAITLGLGTSKSISSQYGTMLETVDMIVLYIFVTEILLKLYAYGLRFFRSGWNIFDLIIVGIGFMPQSDSMSALRGLRVLRAMRIFSLIPQMRAVVQALLDAVPGMGAVMLMLSIVYYIFAVMATIMYGDTFNEWFGTLGRSMYSLFQIMTLESWSMGIVRPVMEVYPTAWAFFVPFIIITSFSVLNLFIGLLVNTMQSAVEDETNEEIAHLNETVQQETKMLNERVKELHDEISSLQTYIRSVLHERSSKQ